METDVTDAAAIADVFQTRRPEVVFHLAAQIDVRRSVADPVFDLGVNVGGTLNLLEAARQSGTPALRPRLDRRGDLRRGLGTRSPLDERPSAGRTPTTGRASTRPRATCRCTGAFTTLSAITLRLGNVYGPRQDPLGEAGVVAIFCGALLGGGTPRVFGDGHQTRDYVYVGDIVEAFLAGGGSEARGTYNIGTGVETSVLELGSLLASVCEREFDPEMAPARPGEVQRIAIDSARAASELGWRPRTGLEDGLRATAASFR